MPKVKKALIKGKLKYINYDLDEEEIEQESDNSSTVEKDNNQNEKKLGKKRTHEEMQKIYPNRTVNKRDNEEFITKNKKNKLKKKFLEYYLLVILINLLLKVS